MEQDKKKIEFKRIEELVELKGRTVLEIGCGDGRVSSWLKGKVKKLIAIDPDDQNIKKARLRVKGVDFRLGSGESLEFNNRSFNTVIFTFSLHHQDSKRALEQAFRVLKKDGQLFIIEPTNRGEVQKLFCLFENETQEIRNTLKAIYSGNFKFEKNITFTTDWIFNDKEELYNYYFKYYKERKNSKVIREIDRLLGRKRDLRPIILKDEISIFSLRRK